MSTNNNILPATAFYSKDRESQYVHARRGEVTVTIWHPNILEIWRAQHTHVWTRTARAEDLAVSTLKHQADSVWCDRASAK